MQSQEITIFYRKYDVFFKAINRLKALKADIQSTASKIYLKNVNQVK